MREMWGLPLGIGGWTFDANWRLPHSEVRKEMPAGRAFVSARLFRRL
jgi:hypothetical protein